MRDFVKLTKETWKFYLAVFAVLFVPVLGNGLYLCHEMKFEYKEGMGFSGVGAAFTTLVSDKVSWSLDPIGFMTAVITIIAVLLIRQLALMGSREFQQFLPVRQRNRVMHDYVSLLAILLGLNLVQTAVFVGGQTAYNRAALKKAMELGVGNLAEDYISAPNWLLLKHCACYLVFTVFVFNLIYLGALLAKNMLVGIGLTIILWRAFLMILDFLAGVLFSPGCEEWYEISWYTMLRQVLDGELSQERWEVWYLLVDKIKMALLPENFWGFVSGNVEAWDAIYITVGAAVLLFLIIFVSAGRRELTKGKLFYFRWTEVLFGVFCAIGSGAMLIEMDVMHIAGVFFCSVLVGTLACFLVKPVSKNRRTQWEVR